MSPQPYPAPTPWQPRQMGGNPNVRQGLIGPMIRTNMPGPIPARNGATYMTNANRSPFILGATNTRTKKPPAGGGGGADSGTRQTNNFSTGGGDNGGDSGGGGGGGYFDDSTGQTFGSIDDFYREIDSVYNPQNSYLDEVEGNLRRDFPNVLAEAEANYNANEAHLTGSRNMARGKVKSNRDAGQKRKEDAQAASRRLFQELSMGNTQRFGGASSAGQAASELQGREFQTQQGQTNRQASELNSQLDQQDAEIESSYSSGVLKLKQDLQAGIAQAQRDFQNKLMEITSNRTQIATAKAQARLGALMELRNKVFAIQQQNQQFQQQLDMMREQAKLNVDSYRKTSGGLMANSDNSFGQFAASASTNPQAFNTVGKRNVSFQGGEYVGQIGKSAIGRDELGRIIYSDGTRGWGGFMQN